MPTRRVFALRTGPLRGGSLSLALAASLVLPVGLASAQEADDGRPVTARDALLDDLLDRAASKERMGDLEQAVKLYLELETQLEKRRIKDRNDRPTTEVAPGVDRGMGLYLRDRVARLPEHARARYRLTIDPRAKIALETALRSEDPKALERLITRYPLSSVIPRALEVLARRSLERGELGKAVRAYEELEDRARAGEKPQVARRAALRRLLTALLRRDTRASQLAADAYKDLGGDLDAARSGSEATLAARVARLGQAGSQREKGLVPRYPLGDVARRVLLPNPELPPELVERLPELPAYQDPVFAQGAFYVADSKTVRRVALKGGERSWTYSASDPESQVSRLEAVALSVAAGPGRVFATLHRNRPAKLLPPVKEGDPPLVERLKDWRLVALDHNSGKRLWDAATQDAFAEISRNAEWVSPPLYHDGGVYVTALQRNTDLRASLVRLDPATGKVTYQVFLVSRTAFDFLGVGSPPPAPSVSERGHVLVQTGLGAVAAVDPGSGDLEWISTYDAVPQLSQGAIVSGERRFRSQAALAERTPIVVGAVDASELIALDPETGGEAWTAPRLDARHLLGRGEHVLLVGRRLRILSRADGRLLLQGPDLGAHVRSRPLLLGEEMLASTHSELLRVDLATGAVLERWTYAQPIREAGTPTLLPSGEVATVGFDAVHVFARLETREAQLAQLGPGERELALGLLHARRGDARKALPLLRAAVRSGLTRTRAFAASQAGVDLMVGIALRRGKQDDFKGFRLASEHAFGFLGKIGLRAQRVLGRNNLDLLKRAAPLLRSYADELALKDEPALHAKAAGAFQRLLSAPPGTRVHLGSGAHVEASHYARLRLEELIAKRGPACYEAFAKEAKRALELAKSSKDAHGLEQVIERYPPSPAAKQARWELASLFASQRLNGQAARNYEAFLRDHAGDERCADAMARLVLLYRSTQRLADAREVLERLCESAPAGSITPESGNPAVSVTAWAQAQRTALYKGRGPEALAQDRERRGLDRPLVEVYRSPTVLDMRGPRLVAVNAPGGMKGRVLLRRQSTLSLLRVPEGEELLRIDDVERVSGLVPSLLGDMLVVPHKDRVDGWNLATSPPTRAWTRNFSLGAAGQIGPHAVHRLYAAGDTVVVLGGGNDARALDAKTGKMRWRRALPTRATGGLLVNKHVVIAVSTSPPALAAVSLADGGQRWRHTPLSAPGRSPRVASPRWVGTDHVGFLYGSKDLVVLNAKQGQQVWRNALPGEPWIRGLEVSADGAAMIARTQLGVRFGIAVVDGSNGVVRWVDKGQGAERNGAPPPQKAASNIVNRDGLFLGEETVYTLRESNGRTELYAQDMSVGTLRWRWSLPMGARAYTLVEAPTSVFVANSGLVGSRLQVDVLEIGNGRHRRTHRLRGRQLVGAKAAVTGSTLVLSGEKGIFSFRRRDDEALAREGVELARQVARAPTDASARARLANRLARDNRLEEALELLNEGVTAEGVRTRAFDQLFAQLASLRERHSELNPLTVGIRRLPRPPEIDGELNDWWRDWTAIDMTSPRFVQPVQQPPGASPGRWTGREDLSAKLYMGYDDRYFYFALDVNDMHLRPYDTESERWIGDCLLIAIDCRNDGGDGARGDDLLLSLALTLPKKKKDEDEDKDPEEQEEEANKKKPDGRYFVHRKEDKSGAIYEVAIPWETLAKNGATIVPGRAPRAGFTFGLNVLVTDDDGDRSGGAKGDTGPRGALKVLELTPGVLLHHEKSRLWKGFIPKRFAKIRVE